MAGECRDKSFIHKVEEFNEAYRMQEKGTVLNWFDITAPEGYLSLNDQMGDVMATFRGKLILLWLIKKLLPKDSKGGKPSAAGFEFDASMLQMVESFTVIRLLSMAGGMLNIAFTKEELLKLNAQLNKIKTPKVK